jgi:hypothetical protein
MTLAIAHSRGWLDYDELVCRYWPEFAQNGKEKITVRQLLAHQAGLFALDEPVDKSIVADLDQLAVVLARQKPAWESGTRQALSELPASHAAWFPISLQGCQSLHYQKVRLNPLSIRPHRELNHSLEL